MRYLVTDFSLLLTSVSYFIPFDLMGVNNIYILLCRHTHFSFFDYRLTIYFKARGQHL